MANITLEGIAEVIREELKPVNERLDKIETRLSNVEQTVNLHTAALEQLLTEKKNREDNKTVSDGRLEYIEHWAKQVSQKLGIEFKP